MDFPYSSCLPPHGVLSSFGHYSQMAGACSFCGLLATTAAAWPSADRAYYIPIQLDVPFLVRRLGWHNGATVAGNVDAAVLDAVGTRLVSAGSTAMAGASVVQTVDVTDTVINPGVVYLALASSSATATFFRAAPSSLLMAASGLRMQATALPIPAAASFATMGSGAFVPIVVAAGRTVL